MFWSRQFLLWGDIRYVLGCLVKQYPWPLPIRCQEHPLPSVTTKNASTHCQIPLGVGALGWKQEAQNHLQLKTTTPDLFTNLNKIQKAVGCSKLPSKLITGEIYTDFIFIWAPKSLQMVIATMKLKDACSLEGKLWPTQTAY